MGLGEELKRRGIVAAVAHTDASCAVCEEAFRHGYSLMTHFYCAMSTVAKRGYSRYAGAVEAGYLQDFDIEVIADGVHLPDDLLRLVYRLKGPDRVVLCTDSIRATGLPDGEYIQGSLENGLKFIVENGVALRPDRGGLAGSVATTDRLVRTMARAAGLPRRRHPGRRPDDDRHPRPHPRPPRQGPPRPRLRRRHRPLRRHRHRLPRLHRRKRNPAGGLTRFNPPAMGAPCIQVLVPVHRRDRYGHRTNLPAGRKCG